VPDLAPDQDTDFRDGDSVDSQPDTAPDGEDADAPPECIFDDTVELDAYCRLMQVDVAREIPGGRDRTLYTFQIDYPEGDYDLRCLVMDEFTVTRGGEVIRTAAASFDPAADRFFMDDEATPGELEACGGEGRANLFTVSYSGRSPVGKFIGVKGRVISSYPVRIMRPRFPSTTTRPHFHDPGGGDLARRPCAFC
jgi:hypothetical protein